MKKQKEHKKVDINYFLIPMLIVSVLFFIFTYSLVQSQIKTQYDNLEDIALKLTNSYSHSVVGQNLAAEIINQLLAEKLEITMNAIVVNEHHWTNESLTELGNKLGLDAIYVYDSMGIVRLSMNSKYLGWTAYPGHPVYDFMISSDTIRIEEIRKDSESDDYLKHGYLRIENQNNFIQVGIFAENINELLDIFSIESFIKKVKYEDDLDELIYINLDRQITATTCENCIVLDLTKGVDLEELLSEQIEVTRVNDNMLRVFVPIGHDGVEYGWLAMYWPSKETDDKVRTIIIGGIFLYIVFTCVVGFIIYYAYRKDKSNYKLAYYDSLTGLPNRSFLKEHLEAVYDLNPASYSAFIAVNCVNLSTIIATYGYSFGDEIIKQFHNKLNQILNKDDKLFRFSSDRFVILVDCQKTAEYQKDLTNEIINVFKQPLVFENAQQHVSIEVGVVELDGHQKEVSQIFQEASITLSFLREKNIHIGMYNDQMEAYVKNEDFIEHVIRRAISRSQEVSMSMVYQPLVNISEGRIVGFEALLRVSTDSGLAISPQAVIAVAEKKQLIYELGNQILFDVCQFIKRINSDGFHNIRVAVNISGIQLVREEFIDSIKSIIQDNDIASSNLEFEITESVLLDNLEIINQKLNEVRNLGIAIALDDFGTGYSSLSRLSDLNFDKVKIDKFFIDKIETHDSDKLITVDIISMSHKLGLIVVAEGVETKKQWDYLKETKCDIVQGYYVSRPLVADDAMKILASKNISSSD